MAIRIIGTSVGAPVAETAVFVDSSASTSARSLAANRCGHNRSTAKAKQRDRDRDPPPSEDRPGAVGEPRPDRAREVGGEPEGAEHPEHDQRDRGDVTPVAVELAAGRRPAPSHHPGPWRRAAGFGPACASAVCGPVSGAGAWGATPRRGRRHPRTLTLVTRATAASCASRPAAPENFAGSPTSNVRSRRRTWGQTSITTGMMAGRRGCAR